MVEFKRDLEKKNWKVERLKEQHEVIEEDAQFDLSHPRQPPHGGGTSGPKLPAWGPASTGAGLIHDPAGAVIAGGHRVPPLPPPVHHQHQGAGSPALP